MDFSLFSSSLVLRHVSVVSLEAFRSRLASESRQGLQRQQEKNAQIGPIKRGIRKKGSATCLSRLWVSLDSFMTL